MYRVLILTADDAEEFELSQLSKLPRFSKSRVNIGAIASVAAAVLIQACGSSESAAPSVTATTLSVTVAPSSSAPNGVAFAVQPVVQLRDARGNRVAQSGVVVTASIADVGAVLAGSTAVVTSAEGVATFHDLFLVGVAGQHELRFSADGLDAVTAPITLAAGAPTALILNSGNGLTAAAGTTLVPSPTVKVVDANGNGVGGVAVSFGVGVGSGSIANPTTLTGPDGIAAVDGWTLGPVAGTNTLSALVTGLSGSPQILTATGVPGAPARVIITRVAQTRFDSTLPHLTHATFLGNDTVSVEVSICDKFGNLTPSAEAFVTLAYLYGANPESQAIAGIARFSQLKFGATTPRMSSQLIVRSFGLLPDTINYEAGVGATTRVDIHSDANAVAGKSFNVTVALYDSLGNTQYASRAGCLVYLSLEPGIGPSGATLTAPPVQFLSTLGFGQAVAFWTASIDKPGTYVLAGTCYSLKGFSNPVTVSPPP